MTSRRSVLFFASLYKASGSVFGRFRGAWAPRKYLMLLAFGSGLLLSGCDPKSATAELNTGKEMIAALTPKIPVGTTLEAAKAFMTEQGFTIEEMKKARWKKTPNLNFLLCKRLDGQPPIKRQWEVALIHNDKTLTSIDVRTALVYP